MIKQKLMIFILILLLSFLITSCDKAITAVHTTNEIDIVIDEWSKKDIKTDSLLPYFEGTVVLYFIDDIQIYDLNQHNKPLYDQYRTLEVEIYGTDATMTRYYDIYILSEYSPRQKYEIRINGVDLEFLERDNFMESVISINQEDKIILENIDSRIRGRGNSTFYAHEKKSLKVEFSEPIEVMGLNRSSSFNLVAMHGDKSLMRDALAHLLSGMISLEKIKNIRYVSLYINDQYHGLYLLIEDRKHIKIDENIEELQFALEIDQRVDWEPWRYEETPFFQVQDLFYVIKRPFNPSVEEYDSISSYIENLVFELRNGQLDENKVDILNWVKFIFINEYFKNVDSWGLSVFLYKQANAPLKFGPVWDFDLSLGNADYVNDEYNSPEGYWLINHPVASLVKYSMRISEMENAYNEFIMNFYNEKFPIWIKVIDSLYLAVKDYALENFSRWPILNEYVWPNPEFLLTETYDEQFEFVRYFLHERLLWMSKDIYN